MFVLHMDSLHLHLVLRIRLFAQAWVHARVPVRLPCVAVHTV